MSKTILTYSWLAKRAMSLFKRDRAAYFDLVGRTGGSGTDKMLRGVFVQWNRTHYCQQFIVREPRSGRHYFSVRGCVRGGKMYSQFVANFTTTQYRKRITDKYMPVTLPDGVKCSTGKHRGNTPCIFHNADGTKAMEGIWYGGRRNRIGNPSTLMIIRDEDGKFMSEIPQECMLPTDDDDCVGFLGWYEAASRTRAEWLDSIKAIPQGMCNHKQMLTVAAKSYLAAARMVEKHPGTRMALFPAEPVADGALQEWRHGDSITAKTVMSRLPDGTPVLYYLPEVLLWWKAKDNECGQPGYIQVSMTIPPHGNPSLDPTGKAAFSSMTSRDGKQPRYGYRLPLPEAYEQAYHSLRCFRSDVPPRERNGIHQTYKYDPYPSTDPSYGPEDAKLVVWPENKDKVLAVIKSRTLESYEVDLPMDMGTPVGLTPDAVTGMFEEQLLLESLPLC